MITDFETAKWIRNIGFNKPIHTYYSTINQKIEYSKTPRDFNGLKESPEYILSAPTYDEAIQFILDKFKIFIGFSVGFVLEEKTPTFLYNILQIMPEGYIKYPFKEDIDGAKTIDEAKIKVINYLKDFIFIAAPK